MAKSNNRGDWKVSKSEKLYYFLGRIGIFGEQALIPNMMNTFLIFNGISLASVAFFTLIVKFIDAFDDLLFGFLVDKIDLKKNKFVAKIAGQGRYMPWIRCFLWIFPVVVVAFFLMPANISEGAKIAWFCVTYLLFDLTYTIVDVPTQALSMTITDVPEERNNLLTIGMVLITGIMFVAGILQTVLISEGVGMSVASVCIIMAIIYAVCMVPFTFKVKEHNSEMKNVEEDNTQENYTLKEMVKALIHNKPYLILQLTNLVKTIAMTGTAVGLFVSFYLYGSSTAMVVPGIIALVAGLVLQMLAPKICSKFGNRNTAVFCLLLSGISGVIIFLTGWQNFGLVVLYTVFSGTLGSLATMACTYMQLQTIDFGKYTAGRDTTGIFNSIGTFIGKTAPSLASSLGLVLLSISGWVSVEAKSFADLASQNVAQPHSALTSLWVLNILIPAIGVLLSGIIMLFLYKLTDEDARLMSKCIAGEISKEECELMLTKKK